MENILLTSVTKDNIEDVQIKKYLSTDNKKIIASALCSFVLLQENDQYYYYKIDFNKYFALLALQYYTNIELSGDDSKDYDYLEEEGLYKIVRDKIGDDLFTLESYCLDYLKVECDKQNNISRVVSDKMDIIVNSADKIVTSISNVIDKTDGNTAAKYLGKGIDKIGDALLETKLFSGLEEIIEQTKVKK